MIFILQGISRLLESKKYIFYDNNLIRNFSKKFSKKRQQIFKICQITLTILIILICLIVNFILIIWNFKYKNEINFLTNEQKNCLDFIKELQHDQIIISKKV